MTIAFAIEQKETPDTKSYQEYINSRPTPAIGPDGEGGYFVTSSKMDAVYHITLVATNLHKVYECNCKAAQNNRYCKHLAYLSQLQHDARQVWLERKITELKEWVAVAERKITWLRNRIENNSQPLTRVDFIEYSTDLTHWQSVLERCSTLLAEAEAGKW